MYIIFINMLFSLTENIELQYSGFPRGKSKW